MAAVETPLDAYSRVVTEVARALAPSVANLRISRRSRRGGWLGGGSAFVLAPDGYLVTSAHLVEHRGSGRGSFVDGRDERFRLLGAHPPSDLAVLRAEGPGPPAATLRGAHAVQVRPLLGA